MEFGWGPDQTLALTLQQMEHYLHQLNRYRANIRRQDTSLELIRKALFSFFGIKDPTALTDNKLEQQIKAVNPMGESFPKLTKEEADAWMAAGMPSPFDGWIRSYRNGT